MATYTGLDGLTGNAFDIVLGGLTITSGAFTPSGGISDADLNLNSTNRLDIQIGAVDILGLDDAAISSFAGGADVAGQDLFIETQDGGAAGADTAGKAGGLLNIKTGDGADPGADGGANPAGGAGGLMAISTGKGGAVADGTGTGGAGGAITITSGVGDTGGAAGAGGAGGNITIEAGVGAAPVSGSANGGDGGDVNVLSGVGGAAGAGGGTGGSGGVVLLTPGAAGGAGGGSAGVIGHVQIAVGFNLKMGTAGNFSGNPGTNGITFFAGTAPNGTATTAGQLYVDTAGNNTSFEHADGSEDLLASNV